MLTGDGSFRTITYKIGKVEKENCILYCGETEAPKHTFFKCDRFERKRHKTRVEMETLTVENIVALIIRKKENWGAVKRNPKRLVSKHIKKLYKTEEF